MSTLIKPTGEDALIIERGEFVTQKFTRVSNLSRWQLCDEPAPVPGWAWYALLGFALAVFFLAAFLENARIV